MTALAKAIALFLFGCIALSMLSTYLFSRPNNPSSLYDVLGLPSVQSTNKDIKQHYRGLIRRIHPDHRRGKELTEEEKKFSLDQINQAYNTLSNPSKRIRYDYTLAHASHFHNEVYTKSQRDKVPRIYEYNAAWDQDGIYGGGKGQKNNGLFSQIDQILLGYEIRYPQYSKLSREIYQSASSSNSDDGMGDIPIKPYILVKSSGYDNVVTYHFSDWQDQLDQPRQNLINGGMIIFSAISAIVPIWFVCAPSKKDDSDDAGRDGEEDYDENGNVIRVSLEEYEKAGWTPENIKKHQQQMKEKNEIDSYNRQIDEEEKQRIRELNKANRVVQEQLKKEKMLNAAKKAFEGKKQANLAASAEKEQALATKLLNEANGNQPFSCGPCKKVYQSDNQFQQHLTSAKHLKTVKDLDSNSANNDKKKK